MAFYPKYANTRYFIILGCWNIKLKRNCCLLKCINGKDLVDEVVSFSGYTDNCAIAKILAK